MPDRSDIPDFTVSVRGYDRRQVDEYVHRLTRDLDEAHGRALAAEQRPVPTAGGSFADLGPHVAGVLQRATEEAQQLRSDAQTYADTIREQAERKAQDLLPLTGHEAQAATAQRDAMLAEARNRADELLQRSQRHADERAKQTLAATEQEMLALREEVAAVRAAHEHAVQQARATAQRLLEVAGPVQIDLRDAVGVTS
ncbi:MAG: hypothetical protein H7323_01105 [Frankiales bacterium]|nr:hypothetical protein [Frankiales bacterium]